jgi:hypothetical protein
MDTPIRRLVVGAAATLTILLIAASTVQLKPFFWDPPHLSTSLQEFQAHRTVLMTGMWLRAMVLIPAIFLAVGLYHLFERQDRAAAQAGALLLVAGGLLNAVSGWVGVAIGVPAERYQAEAGDAHALEVLAHSLFWVQDNLLTMANITLAGAVATFSYIMRRQGGFARWMVSAGMLTLPFALVASLSYYGHRTLVYLTGTAPMELALLVWVTGLVLSCMRPSPRPLAPELQATAR